MHTHTHAPAHTPPFHQRKPCSSHLIEIPSRMASSATSCVPYPLPAVLCAGQTPRPAVIPSRVVLPRAVPVLCVAGLGCSLPSSETQCPPGVAASLEPVSYESSSSVSLPLQVMRKSHEAREKLLRLGIFRQVDVLIDTCQGTLQVAPRTPFLSSQPCVVVWPDARRSSGQPGKQLPSLL